MEHSETSAPPRRDEALAIIIEWIARKRVSPTYDEIGEAMRPQVKKTRARQLVDQLVRRGIVEKKPGSQRNLMVRDVAAARCSLEEVARNLGWTVAAPMGELQEPCPKVQLPRVIEIRHLPDE